MASVAPDSEGVREVVASELSVLPPDVTPPRITGMSLEGDTVSLKVAGTRPYLTYDVKGTPDLSSSDSARVACAKKDGTTAGEMVIQADGTKSRFFKVVVDR